MLDGESWLLPQEATKDPPPPLLPSAESLWRAWERLAWSRPVGFGMGAIPVSEVLSYCQLRGIRDLDQRERILWAVQALDKAFLQHWAEKEEED